MSGTVDLTGRWTGVYFYPIDPDWNANDDMPATPFTAELTDAGGRVTGHTKEPDLLARHGGPPVEAVLDGSHDGARLTFTKFPDGRDRDHVIQYDGDISSDGDSVAGHWTIPGSWSGTFQMQRRVTTTTVAEEQSASV